MIRVYLLLHRATGNFLPILREGMTRWNPEGQSPKIKPRVFPSKSAASRCKNMWETGVLVTSHKPTAPYLILEEETDRKVDDLRIVKAYLTW
jgi:hypothetical protein